MNQKETYILKKAGWYIDNISPKCKLIMRDTSNGFTCQIQISNNETLISIISKVYHNFDEQDYVKNWQDWAKAYPSCWHPKSELERSAREQKQALQELYKALSA